MFCFLVTRLISKRTSLACAAILKLIMKFYSLIGEESKESAYPKNRFKICRFSAKNFISLSPNNLTYLGADKSLHNPLLAISTS